MSIIHIISLWDTQVQSLAFKLSPIKDNLLLFTSTKDGVYTFHAGFRIRIFAFFMPGASHIFFILNHDKSAPRAHPSSEDVSLQLPGNPKFENLWALESSGVMIHKTYLNVLQLIKIQFSSSSVQVQFKFSPCSVHVQFQFSFINIYFI